MIILPIAFIIGSIVSTPTDWPDYRKETVPDAPGNSQLYKNKSYTKTYCFHPGNWATLKIFGMDHYFPTTWRNDFLCIYELDNAKMFFTVWGSLYKDPGDKQLKPTLRNRNALKKLNTMAEGSEYRSMGRGRSPLSTNCFPYPHLGSCGSTTSCPIRLYQRKDRVLWGYQFKNRSLINPRIQYFQLGNFLPFPSLPFKTYQGTYPSNHGQCSVAQSQKLKTFLLSASQPSHSSFFTSLFTRTQSNRASMENYPAACYPQPLLFRYTNTKRCSYESVCSMGIT